MSATATQQIAIVTGGAQGIGWSIAQRLRADGLRVIAVDRSPKLTAEQPQAGIEWRELDVTDHAAVTEVFDALSTEGELAVLVNNAGVQRHGALESLTVAEWRAVVDVNLHGVFSCTQAAGRHMLARGSGSIVNIASISARGSAGRSPYAATKAAVVGFTSTAAAEWASRGVRVNAVAPGYVDTGLYRDGVASGALDVDTIMARIPARRVADPAEIASVVSFLASPAASYVTGQTLYVDGGFIVDYGVPLAGLAGSAR